MLGRAAIIVGLLLSAGVAPAQPAALPPVPAPPTGGGEPPLTQAPVDPRGVQPARQPESEVVLPNGQRVTLPQSVRQQIRFAPRYGTPFNYTRTELGSDGKDGQRWVITGGVIASVVYLDTNPGANGLPAGGPPQEVEFATDNVVAWVSSPDADPSGGVNADGRTRVELYLNGNVVIRRFTAGTGINGRFLNQVLRADEVYYDVQKNKAVAHDADIELRVQNVPDPIHLTGRELLQYSPNEIQVNTADVFSSKLPSDPGLLVSSRTSTLLRGGGPRTNLFGLPYRDLRTGQISTEQRQSLESERVRLRIFDVPVFFLPRSTTDLSEPFGPLAGFGVGNDRVFGAQVYTTFDLFKLLGLRPPAGHRWVLTADYLSLRGTGVGTTYDYQGRDFLGRAGPRDPATGLTEHPEWDTAFTGFFRAYSINDKGQDNLGPDRLVPPKPFVRSRVQWQQNGDLYESGTTYLRAVGQAEHQSDPNFFEQYYKQEFDQRMNRETFLQVVGADGNRWGSLLAQKNFDRPWVTEANSLPRADAALVGQDLGPFTYTAKGSLGYYQLRPADPTLTPASLLLTEQQDVNTFRGDLQQRIGLPVDVGPVRVEPYGLMDLSYYSLALDGAGRASDDGRGRFYGGGGARASTTLNKLYPDVRSELFNLTGINHKTVWTANYLNAYSDTPFTRLPLIDRLTDDATDLAYRNARIAYVFGRGTRPVVQPDGSVVQVRNSLVSDAADSALARSPVFDPQRQAIRRATPDRVDTLDSLEVLQLETRQRWQTKRGFPGQEHVVDYVSLDLSMNVYPQKDRDNFGESTGLYQYGFNWNVGDRVNIFSNGWYEPFQEFAPRFLSVGAGANRPDGSYYYLAYQHIDPVEGRVVNAGLSYMLSRKYSVNGGFSYDFGATRNQITSLSFARTGTDLTFLVGFSYNAIVNNFGFQFAVVPNLAGISGSRLAFGGLNTAYGNAGTGR